MTKAHTIIGNIMSAVMFMIMGAVMLVDVGGCVTVYISMVMGAVVIVIMFEDAGEYGCYEDGYSDHNYESFFAGVFERFIGG